MFRFRPLAAAVLCTAALAACSDSTGTDRGGDALVNASNRNLPAEIITHATESETVTPGGPGLEAATVCAQIPLMAPGSESSYYCPPPYEPTDPYYPPPPSVVQPGRFPRRPSPAAATRATRRST